MNEVTCRHATLGWSFVNLSMELSHAVRVCPFKRLFFSKKNSPQPPGRHAGIRPLASLDIRRDGAQLGLGTSRTETSVHETNRAQPEVQHSYHRLLPVGRLN